MRIGLMTGPDRGRYGQKVARMVATAQAAEAVGYESLWIPQIPDEFDAMTACALMGNATSTIEIGTAVVPIQTRHPVAMAQQVLATQEACQGRFSLGLGPSHHWIVADMLGLDYDKPAVRIRNYLDVLEVAFAGPGPVDVVNDDFTIHNPLDVTTLGPTPILLAALAPLMLKIAGERTDGTILWMADERAIAGHVVPKLAAAAAGVGRPTPRVVAGVPVTVCRDADVDAARGYANVILAHAEYSPNYQRLLEEGDARDVGDVLCGGSEEAVRARVERFRDAGVTDFAVRVVPFGADPAERRACRERTEAFMASLVGTL